MVANINKQIQSKIKCRVLSAGEIKSVYKNKYSITTRSTTKMKMLRKKEKHLSSLLEDTSNNTVAECHDTDANNSNFESDDDNDTNDDADDLVETAIAFHDDESDVDENDDAVDEDSDDEPFVIDNNIKDDGLKDSLCLELKCSKRRATTRQTTQYKDFYIW